MNSARSTLLGSGNGQRPVPGGHLSISRWALPIHSMQILAVHSIARCLRAVSAAVAVRGGEPSSVVSGAGFVCGGSTAGAAGEFANRWRVASNRALKRTRHGGPGLCALPSPSAPLRSA
jgi:hypothetical protein